MTKLRQTYLRCDFPGCLDNTSEWDANTVKQARQCAKQLGWTYTRDGGDRCHRHPKEDGKGTAT